MQTLEIDPKKIYKVGILFSSGKEIITYMTDMFKKSDGSWHYTSAGSPYILVTSAVDCLYIIDEVEGELQ